MGKPSAVKPPLGTRDLSDVVGNAFRSSDYGPLFLDAPASVMAGSRTATAAPMGGRYGLFVPAVDASAGITSVTPPLVLISAQRGASFRVNVGLTETAGAAADAEVVVKDGRGAPKGSASMHVAAFSLTQLNDVYAAVGAAAGDDDRIEVRVVSGAGRIVPYLTAVDNRTNDGSFVGGAPAAPEILLPAVANAAGLFGALFRTDVKLANPGPSPLRVRISYTPSLGDAAAPVVVSLGVNETHLVSDILTTLLGLQGAAAGALRVTALDGGRVLATSRTYADGPDGTFGLSFDPSEAVDTAVPGQRLALTFLSRSSATRTNVGFIETAGVATAFRVTLYGTDGTVRSAREFAIDGGAAVQWNDVFGTMGVASGEGSAIVEVLSGGALAAYAATVDNQTNDGSLVPAKLVPDGANR